MLQSRAFNTFGDVVDVGTKQKLVIEVFTAEGSIPIHRCLRGVCGEDAIDISSDAGSVVLRAVKRTMVAGTAVADQPQQ